MNEIKISTNSDYMLVIIILCICLIWAGVLYYYKGTDKSIKRELDNIERISAELASETRQLQESVASHSTGIASVSTTIIKSRERIENVYTDLEKSGNEVTRAIVIIDKCEQIIEEVKAKRKD